MHVTRFDKAKPYTAPEHDGIHMLRLQGKEASPATSMWSAALQILPGGSTSLKASHQEKIYVVLEGEVTLCSDREEHVLRPWDSCLFVRDEPRRLENRSNRPATILLVMGEH